MSNRTNNLPPFSPSAMETPPANGFQANTVIGSAAVNGTTYIGYNFANSFINALIANSQLTDSATYSYTDKDWKKKITADLNSWIVNTISISDLTGITISDGSTHEMSIEPNVTEYKDTSDATYDYVTWLYPKYFAIEKSDKSYNLKAVSELYSDKLTFDDKDGDTSELTYAHLVFSTNRNDDTGTYTDSSISFHTSEGYTSTYGTSSITLNDSDGKMEITTTGIKTTVGLFSYNAYVDANNKPTFVSKLSNGNTVSINPVPAVAFNNIYSGFTSLQGVYTKDFTYTSASAADNADNDIIDFINSSGLTVLGITVHRYFSSIGGYQDTPVFPVKQATTFVFTYMSYVANSGVNWYVTSLKSLYSSGTMTIKVLCN